MRRLLLLALLVLFLAACDVPTPTATPTPEPTATCPACPTCVPTPTVTRTTTATMTATPTPGQMHQCVNYEQNCVPLHLACGDGRIDDPYGQCGAGFRCCAVVGITNTPTATRTPGTPTMTPTPSATRSVTPGVALDTPGFYSQYDYPCPVAMVPGKLPNGTIMPLCPNGLNDDRTWKNDNAFRTPGGMDWDALARYSPNAASQDAIRMGGVFQTFWFQLNPQPGVYEWSIIDNFVAYARQNLIMETPDGMKPKGVIVKISNAISQRPAGRQPVTGIDGGFIFDDLTPAWVREQMKGAVSWGGPKRLSDGSQVTTDDGSYWVKAPCVYTDYRAAHLYGSNWDYSIWVVSKYDNPTWRAAAKTFMQALSDHYAGSDITFLVGLNGMDGEYGNWLQTSFAGCENLRNLAYAQYPSLRQEGGTVRDLPQWWNTKARAYLGYTSDVDISTFLWLDLGLHQARNVPDSPIYVYAGQGVLEVPMAYSMTKAIAWENAYSWTKDDAELYQMLSVAMSTFPRWYDIMGGLWQASKPLLREFVGQMGRTVTDTPEVWWKAYWTCFGNDVDCPGIDYDHASQWRGWPRDLEAGLSADRLWHYVDPSRLTAAQRTSPWYRMLREGDEIVLTADARWTGTPAAIVVKWLDVGSAPMIVSWDGGSIVIPRGNTGTFQEMRTNVAGLGRKIKITSTETMMLHEVALWRAP